MNASSSRRLPEPITEQPPHRPGGETDKNRARATRHLGAVFFCGCTLLITAPAQGQEARDFCPDRPGLGTPACTLEPGVVMVELGAAEWTRESDSTTRSDTIATGDLLVRLGVTPQLEAQIGWGGYAHVRERDRATGARSSDDGVGDLTLALRRNLANPDGSGFSIALMPYATLPIGNTPAGAGDWGAGLLIPISYALAGDIALALTPEVNAAPDSDSNGRHLAYGAVIGVEFPLHDAVTGTLELAVTHDRDPDGHSTETLAAFSLGWQPADDWQIDAGSSFGLNHDSPDFTLSLGVARRF